MFKSLFKKPLVEKYIIENSREIVTTYDVAREYKRQAQTCPECGYYSKEDPPEIFEELGRGYSMSPFGSEKRILFKVCICNKCGCKFKYKTNPKYEDALRWHDKAIMENKMYRLTER